MRVFKGIMVLPLLLAGCHNMPDYSLSRQPAKPLLKSPAAPAPETISPPRQIVAPLPAASYDGLKLPDTPTPVRQMPPVVVQPQRKLADGHDMPAVQSLLASASASLNQGRPEDAASSLERAQRLAPQSAAVYQKLAEVRLQQGRFVEAEQLARKGLAYAQGNSQQAALWRVVAAAADKQGKADSASHARDKVQQLEQSGDRG